MKRIEIFQDHGVFISNSIETDFHKHHALEIIVSSEPLTVRVSNTDIIRSKAVLIMPDQPHQTIANSVTAFHFIEPESVLASTILNSLNILSNTSDIEVQVTLHKLKILAEGSIPTDWSIKKSSMVQLDSRLNQVIEFVRQNIATQKIDLDTLSDVACLSSGRLTHLFKEQVGIPLRPFILWCRMRIAVSSVLSGMNLTQAAYEAGFSDAAHLSRTFLEMFGVNPSLALKQ